MIVENQIPELRLFRKIERQLPLQINWDCEKLVVQNSNDALPVHRWFKFKEAFSADLLAKMLREVLGTLGKNICLLDPFCGVGTGLVASQEMGALGYRFNSIGIERNPFIAFTAQTKTSWPMIDPVRLLEIGEKSLARAIHVHGEIPPLSSLTTGRCISRYFCRRLLAIQGEIQRDGITKTHDALLLGLASAIEPVSYVRKDGRALRIVDRTSQRLSAVLRDRWAAISEDTKFLKNTLPEPNLTKVLVGDGRRPSLLGIQPNSIDLVFTSPPYPNNIDYSEVYKLELWLLGFVKRSDEFLKLRKMTFRSHPACSEPDELNDFMSAIARGRIEEILGPILKRMTGNSERWRKKVLLGYFHDMWVSLKEQFRCLRAGGYSILVVGNSLHGGVHFPYLIPTDILVASLGESIGFKVEHFIVARTLKRRLTGNHFLRESVIVLKKPQ